MSTEVGSGLTAASSGAAEDQNQNKSEETRHEEGDMKPQRGDPGDSRGSEADTHNKCEENDKENDESGGGSAAEPTGEAVKRKVVEAPPPKVNPWTKRTTGRVPSSSSVGSSSQDKDQHNTLKVVRASKPRARKSSKVNILCFFGYWYLF
ncbi:la-related protein 1-like [Epinephelus moara]|uniref:la-related protein 1-like n=1 Tax=Epinephelus moara TaxID=300413 RepID=UPI00214F1947|nr:la-related protein 1-like [Epinephelus moara]